jgi:putative endonuclease
MRLRKGRIAEGLAAVLLFLKGWRVIAMRYAAGGGEIDLVALRGEVVAFVEVKARRDRDSALLAVDGVKQERFTRAVRHWLVRNPWAGSKVLRADAVLVMPWQLPVHVPDAFTLRL